MKNELVIFDFFGVLCAEIAPVWFNRYFEENEAKTLKASYFVRGDLGYDDIYEIAEKIAKNHGMDKETILKEWKELTLLNDELFEQIKVLKKDYHLALLSNAPKGLFEFLFGDKKFLYDYFEKVFISAEEKLAKPDFAFYKYCINSFNMDFDKIYMIDDNISNLEKLSQLNIDTILYKKGLNLLELIK